MVHFKNEIGRHKMLSKPLQLFVDKIRLTLTRSDPKLSINQMYSNMWLNPNVLLVIQNGRTEVKTFKPFIRKK